MYQFFVEDDDIGAEQVRITGGDVNHIRNVLRMKPGARIRISSPSGASYFCRIAELGAECVVADLEEEAAGTEFAHHIYLFQGLPKSDKMEQIVQKSVELGVHEIIPVTMRHCVVKLDGKKAMERTKRWQAIAESAAKQSKRSAVPAVRMPVSWREALLLAEELELRMLVPYEKETSLAVTRGIVNGFTKQERIGVLIGPEGGFSETEIAEVRAHPRCQSISLGRRILRTETAGSAVLAMLVYALDE